MSSSALLNAPVLVTGGSGFIGTHLVEALSRGGAKVVNLDLRPPSDPRHTPLWTAGDLTDEKFVAQVLERHAPKYIYNLAANADISQGIEKMRVNVDGLRNLFEQDPRTADFPLIIHASTQLVAGAATGEFDPRRFDPYTAYGESKADSERFLHTLPPERPWVIVRPSTIWGAYHATFPDQIWKYMRRGFYMHPAGLRVRRSYGYVENVVHQLIRIAELPLDVVAGQTFYVGDEPVDSADFLDEFSIALRGRPVRRVPMMFLQLAAFAGEAMRRIGGPSPINLGRLHRMTTDYPVPMEKTFKVLGRGPISQSEGIRRTVEWLDAREG